jgi:hypothetical protein
MRWQIRRTTPLICSSLKRRRIWPVGIPKPTLATVFAVVGNGKVYYHVAGNGSPALDWQKWDRADRVSVLPVPRPRMIVNSRVACAGTVN